MKKVIVLGISKKQAISDPDETGHVGVDFHGTESTTNKRTEIELTRGYNTTLCRSRGELQNLFPRNHK